MISKKVKEYLPIIWLGVIFLYCYYNMPLCYDQYVSQSLYQDNLGFLNYLTGYCWNWVTTINGRFFSCLIIGFFEQNEMLNAFGMTLSIIFIPLIGLKLFKVSNERKTLYLLVASLLILIVGKGIQSEVYFYAGMLFLGAAILVELFALFVMKVLDESFNVTNSFYFFLVCVVGAFWVENLTAALLLCSICLLVYHGVVNKKISYHLLIAVVVFARALVVMYTYRAGSAYSGEDIIVSIFNQMIVVLNTTFYDNAGITALIALVLLFDTIRRVINKNTKNKMGCIIGVGKSIFLLYVFVMHVGIFYNICVEYVKLTLIPAVNVYQTALPILEWNMLARDEYKWWMYLILIILLVESAICHRMQRNALILLCCAIGMIGVPCLAATYFGSRIIATPIMLLIVLVSGIAVDLFEDDSTLIKVISIVLLLGTLIVSDEYYVRFAKIGDIKRFNEDRIQSCVEKQLDGDWNYETDVLELKAIRTDLFMPNIPVGEPHYVFWCNYYGLSEQTIVLYY